MRTNLNSVPALKWAIENHDERKLYRYIIFQGVRNPDDCPPHTHNRDHESRCLSGLVEVTLDGVATVLKPGERIMVPAAAMHSAVGLVPDSRMVCEFDHVDGQGQPISTLGPREVYV